MGFDAYGEPIKAGRSGGPIGGGTGGGPGPGPGGLPGFGGGGTIGGSPSIGSSPESAMLRSLLRKRLLGTRSTPYQQPGESVASGGAPGAPGGVQGLQPFQGMVNGRQPTSSMLSPLGRPGAPPPAPATPGQHPQPGIGPIQGDLTDRTYNDPRVAPFVGLDLLIKHLGAGNLGPNPSQGMLDALRSQALESSEAARSRGELAAQSMDVDPATRASYALRSGLQGQSDVSRSLNDVVANSYAERQKFAQMLLQQMIGGIQQQNVATSGRGGTDWGGILGGLGSVGGAIRR